jgi:VIT1/CCC1 family predicted Fe2+/Mn2+ transporter
MSMAAGEYVSVSSQADAERADLQREAKELAEDIDAERLELTNIYLKRGLEPQLAAEVARQLMEKDALGAHARDELGISEITKARPLRAAIASALSFVVGAAIPLLMAVISPIGQLVWVVAATTLVALAALGAVGAVIGGAAAVTGAIRVSFWGAIAMASTAGIGALIGAAL